MKDYGRHRFLQDFALLATPTPLRSANTIPWLKVFTVSLRCHPPRQYLSTQGALPNSDTASAGARAGDAMQPPPAALFPGLLGQWRRVRRRGRSKPHTRELGSNHY